MLDLKPDVILLDIMMPQMNGFEVLDSIRNCSSIRIPIIICSSLSQEADIRKAYEMGADGYIKKSELSMGKIIETVQGYIS